MRKTKLTLLLLAALLVGVCIGFYGNSAIIRARIQHYSQIPGNMPEHVADMLTDRLKLDVEQQQRVLAVLQAYDGRIQETRDQSRAMFDGLRREMSAQIDRYLTPEQAAKHKQILDEFDRKREEDRALRRALRAPPPPPPPSNAAPAK